MITVKKPNLDLLNETDRKNALVTQEMKQIKKWLADNDYIVNKHSLGEYTDDDDRWVNYLEQRRIKLNRYNFLEGEIIE